ncbi:protein PLASTID TRANSCRIPTIONALLY ACTIVE 14 isoform X2 [Cryptomeria japonica]|uniref:protein PLASTID TRANSCRIPTIONALLY ACTIVE 14 isoform X2 n=1 Tax=Cryptomeria japonica TaxID=3369 RepID=UPI0027D9E98E|nr:protein PLASTID TRANSCRIPTIONALLY ACTIVE 14 isoform X2 [Cryptomeria japonica]
MATILHATPFLDSRFSPKCFTPHPAKIDLFQQRLRIPRHIFPQTKNAGRIMKRVLASAAVSAEKSKSSVQEIPSSELEPVDPDFYAIGLSKHVSIFGVEFKEGPDGIGLYAVRDLPHLRKPRVILEVPMELMLTVSKKLPWMFYPNTVPIGHPIFDIINSTNPEADWDLRLACLLLLAFDTKDSFWQFYGDFLPSVEDSTSLLLATEEELIELQDQNLARNIKHQQERVRNFWKKNWHADVPWKVKRLAHDPERFLWAVSIAQSRCINMTMTIGAKVQESNMLIPYADMINHSFQPKCSFRWRKKDRMLEVLINAGQSIKAGEEMTISYMENCPNDRLMAQYGFSLPVNPWESIEFSGRAKIHLDSFLSAFSIADALSDEDDNFADGAVIAAARTLPTWSEGDLPFLPSMEKKSIDELQEECWKLLGMFPTTVAEDIKKLEAELNDRSKIYGSALKYRIHRKQLILNIIRALPLYMERILF